MNLLGTQTEELSSRSMRSKILALLMVTSSLVASPDRRIAVEEVRIELGDLSQQLRGQKGEIELLHDQLNALQTSLESLKEDKALAKSGEDALEKEKGTALEKRVNVIEKSNKTLIGDLKTLKDHLNQSTETIAKCETKITALDQQLSADIKSLKSSLQSMLVLMQGGEKFHTVQPGDSLGKIAQDYKVSIKSLKELNQLTSDQIVVGQKLLLNK